MTTTKKPLPKCPFCKGSPAVTAVGVFWWVGCSTKINHVLNVMDPDRAKAERLWRKLTGERQR